jgi:hypothetical protein
MNAKNSLSIDIHRLVSRRRAVTALSPPTALIAGTALVLAVTGCGGASKSTTNGASAAPAAPTKAEYVAKANAICSATNGPLDATALKLASTTSPGQAERIIAGSFIPQIKSQLGQIRAIGTPVGGQATIATLDRLLAGDIAKIERDPALAGPAAFADFAKVAHGYGLTECAPLS